MDERILYKKMSIQWHYLIYINKIVRLDNKKCWFQTKERITKVKYWTKHKQKFPLCYGEVSTVSKNEGNICSKFLNIMSGTYSMDLLIQRKVFVLSSFIDEILLSKFIETNWIGSGS